MENNKSLGEIIGILMLPRLHGQLMLFLISILNLESCQVDYQQAFPQAKLSNPIFIQIPHGWHVDKSGKLSQHSYPKYNDKNHYLHLKCNLYWIKQAAHNWFKHLTIGLQNLRFDQSKVDSKLPLMMLSRHLAPCTCFKTREMSLHIWEYR